MVVLIFLCQIFFKSVCSLHFLGSPRYQAQSLGPAPAFVTAWYGDGASMDLQLHLQVFMIEDW